jgi:hypothetical protein
MLWGTNGKKASSTGNLRGYVADVPHILDVPDILDVPHILDVPYSRSSTYYTHY